MAFVEFEKYFLEITYLAFSNSMAIGQAISNSNDFYFT